ncbi:hypothetical protein FGB62_25g615 [Gracilaria domingensis]|nr:hypothetical protein FGB62_25g615 [Gracilaria domingensis]
MIGLLLNLALLVVAGTTCRRAGKEGVRVKKLEKEVGEMEGELSALELEFCTLRQTAKERSEEKDQEWRAKLGRLQEKRAMMEHNLGLEIEELQEELSNLKQLDPQALQRQVRELEDERKSLRKEIAKREEKIVELRIRLGKR